MLDASEAPARRWYHAISHALGAPVAVEDPSPLSRFGRIISDSYWQPKARGMWVRGDLGGCCLQKRQRDTHWARITAPEP
jgi:hypothetical protein